MENEVFDAGGTGHLLIDADDAFREDSIEGIIWRSGLPEAVRLSPVTYVAVRTIDAPEIERLTSDTLNPRNCQKITDRLSARRKALSKLNGQEITCAVVRLPGTTYTIEIDCASNAVVYWEYQAG